jgi:hypothetical protein
VRNRDRLNRSVTHPCANDLEDVLNVELAVIRGPHSDDTQTANQCRNRVSGEPLPQGVRLVRGNLEGETTGSGHSRTPDDDDRTRRVLSGLMADRPEQQADELAMASGADDEQLRVLRSFDESYVRRSLDDTPFESNPVSLAVKCSQGLLDRLIGCALEGFEPILDRGHVHGGTVRNRSNLPGGDDANAAVAKPCLRQCPRERCLRRFRSVYADHDHPTSWG